MKDIATLGSCQMLSFNSPVDRSQQQETKMITGNCYTIEPIGNNTYKIKCRVKRKGKPFTKQETFEGGKRATVRRAQDIVRKLESKAEKESSATSSSLTFLKTFGECIEYYAKYKGIDSRDKTYFIQLQNELGNASIEDVNQRLNEFIKWKSIQRKSNGTAYKAATLNHYRKWTRAVINFCTKNNKIPENSLTKQEMLNEVPRTRIITENEISKLLEATKDIANYFYPALFFSLHIPIRKSALMNMRQNWINGNMITIPAKYTKHKKHDDVIPIPPNMLDYFSSLPSFEYVFFKTFDDGSRRPLSNNDFNRVWKKIKNRAEVEDLHFHDTRHHSATQLLLDGIPERVVMSVGGWKTNMFSTYYNYESLKASEKVFQHFENKA